MHQGHTNQVGSWDPILPDDVMGDQALAGPARGPATRGSDNIEVQQDPGVGIYSQFGI